MAVSHAVASSFAHQAYKTATKIPIIGQHVARLGRIVDIVNSPCAADSSTLIVSFIASAPDALMFAATTLFKPTPRDFIAARLGSPHARAPGGKGRKRLELDVARGIGELFGVEKFSSPSGLYGFALNAFQLTRMLGWYLTIAEATTAGLLRWVSESYQFAGCDVAPTVSCFAHVEPGSVILFGGTWLTLNEWTYDGGNGMTPGFGGLLPVPAGNEWQATFTATAKKPTPAWPETQYIFRLKFITSGGSFEIPPSNVYTKTNADGSQSTVNYYKNAQNINRGIIGVETQYFIQGSGAGIIESASFSFTGKPSLWDLKPDP